MSKKIKLIIKYVILAVVFLVPAALIWRMCAASNSPAETKRVLWNENTIVAYESAGDEFEVKNIVMSSQYRITPDGKFSLESVYYIPTADQIQLTLRYNDSTLKAIKEEFGLDAIPEGDVFEVELVGAVDEENQEVFKLVAEPSLSCEKLMYNYRRYIFDGVKPEEVREIALKVYYVSDTERTELGAIPVYNEAIPLKDYKLTKSDLKGYGQEK